MSTLLTATPTTWQTIDLQSDWERYQPAWDEFVEQHPKGSVFHTSAMIRVFAAAKGHTPVALAAVTDAGEILSLLVAIRVQTLPNVFGAVSSRSVWYAEPLCYDTPESIDSLCELVAEHDRSVATPHAVCRNPSVTTVRSGTGRFGALRLSPPRLFELRARYDAAG